MAKQGKQPSTAGRPQKEQKFHARRRLAVAMEFLAKSEWMEDAIRTLIPNDKQENGTRAGGGNAGKWFWDNADASLTKDQLEKTAELIWGHLKPSNPAAAKPSPEPEIPQKLKDDCDKTFGASGTSEDLQNFIKKYGIGYRSPSLVADVPVINWPTHKPGADTSVSGGRALAEKLGLELDKPKIFFAYRLCFYNPQDLKKRSIVQQHKIFKVRPLTALKLGIKRIAVQLRYDRGFDLVWWEEGDPISDYTTTAATYLFGGNMVLLAED